MNSSAQKLKILGIIPARYASTRLPGKPLCTIGSKTIIQHVYERSQDVLQEVIVATDDQRIYDEVKSFGGKVIMTSTKHKSGTDRVSEALGKTKGTFDVIINIQGDEPFVSKTLLKDLISAFSDTKTDIATPIHPYPNATSFEELSNPNQVKVVTTSDGYALYFSRYPIPYFRDLGNDSQRSSIHYYRHIGLYGYRSEVLKQITKLPISPLEQSEGLEQLRWLQAGYKIKTVLTNDISIGIDTPKDLERAREYYLSHNL